MALSFRGWVALNARGAASASPSASGAVVAVAASCVWNSDGGGRSG